MARAVLEPAESRLQAGLAAPQLAQITLKCLILVGQVILPAAGFQPALAAEPQSCNAPAVEKTLKSGPFYKELLRRFGKPLSCTMVIDGKTIAVTYAFRDHAQLTARIDHTIESSEQRIDIPRMESKRALALLKAAERDSYRPKGCGIAWSHGEGEPRETQTAPREIVFRGAACNCQARLVYDKGFVIALVLRSAC